MDPLEFLAALHGHAEFLAASGGRVCGCTAAQQCEYHGKIAPDLGSMANGLIVGMLEPSPN
jgi:hypothetical protein